MHTINDTFLMILRSALLGQTSDVEPAPEQWPELFRLADSHKLLPMIFEAVFPRLRASDPALAARVKAQGRSQVIAQTLRTEEFLALNRKLREAGIAVTDKLEDGIDCLLIAFDTELTFQKLEDACILLGRKVTYLATNPDWVCPVEFGYIPDCGSMCQSFERATGKKPIFIGKPQPTMIFEVMKKFGAKPEETVVIGDRLYTDIASGNNAGVDTVCVLSGEVTLQEVNESQGVEKPTFLLNHVKDILL